MQLTIAADSIYQGSICRLNASSHEQFNLDTNTRIITCAKGMPSAEGVSSIDDKGRHSVEICLVGAIIGRATGTGDTEEASKYGMRHFPFISSHFLLDVSVSSGLADVILEIPANYRIIWNSTEVLSPTGIKANKSTSYAEKISTYVFSWQDTQPEGTYIIKFDVRTGGPGLLKAAYFPIYYYIIALIAVAAAGTADHVNILIAAIAGAWVFLLRHLNMCDLPQRNVFLFYTTVLFGVFLFVWGATWKMNRYYYNGLFIGIEAATAALTVWIALNAVNNFAINGTLPRWIIRLWGYFVSENVRQQN